MARDTMQTSGCEAIPKMFGADNIGLNTCQYVMRFRTAQQDDQQQNDKKCSDTDNDQMFST